MYNSVDTIMEVIDMEIARPKLSIPEQIERMKKQDIKFDLMSAEEAHEFLQVNNYYFKLKAYAKNYHKYPNVRDGKYRNLDFAYLVELSKLDSYLRKQILSMSVDLEHFIKVKLMRDICNDTSQNGYTIVEQFLRATPGLAEEINNKSQNSTCRHLVNKYRESYAIWHLIELISFHHLEKLARHYYKDRDTTLYSRMMPARILRNAAAHNNCIIHNLKSGDEISFSINKAVNTKISKIPGISRTSREKKMSIKMIHDFVVMLDLYYDIVGDETKKYSFLYLQDLFENRFAKNKEYFIKNEVLMSSFNFTKKIIDYYCSLCV